MANRAMIAKVERARKQVLAAAHKEFTKPAYLAPKTSREDLAVMVAAFKGEVRRVGAGRAEGAGELQRKRANSTLGSLSRNQNVAYGGYSGRGSMKPAVVWANWSCELLTK